MKYREWIEKVWHGVCANNIWCRYWVLYSAIEDKTKKLVQDGVIDSYNADSVRPAINEINKQLGLTWEHNKGWDKG